MKSILLLLHDPITLLSNVRNTLFLLYVSHNPLFNTQLRTALVVLQLLLFHTQLIGHFLILHPNTH